MLSGTVEDYLKELFLQQESEPSNYVHMNALAEAMEVTAGSATVMVQGLARQGYIDYRPRVGSRLTAMGEREALQVLRRHRIIESFLVEVLGLDWSEVHIEAHRLEHVVSELVLERMDALLGHPLVDPHGDPIPSEAGDIDRSSYESLAELPLGQERRIARILDQDPAFLRFLESKGIAPGAMVRLLEGGGVSGAFTLRSGEGEPAVIGDAAARSILVGPQPGSRPR